MTVSDPVELTLFDARPEPSALLRNRFQEPPFTVLDRRAPRWLDRDRKWRALGIRNEEGRSARLTFQLASSGLLKKTTGHQVLTDSSIFSPTLCELVYRWYSRPGCRVLDPFAGGSVRGVIASAMARWYTGIELRPEQVAANREQQDLGGDITPRWIEGDALDLRDLIDPGYEADLVFSCPPYAHLERYSDDPRDLSTMDYAAFLGAYRNVIREATSLLRPDRFVAWVVGEVRDRRGDGSALGLVSDTIAAFRAAGLRLYNDHVVLRPLATAPLRTRQFEASRKAIGTHDYLLVFVKGDARKATRWLESMADVPTTDLDEDAADAAAEVA